MAATTPLPTKPMNSKRIVRPARTIAILALCTALVFGFQVALAAIPNGECVTLLFILFTLYFRYHTLYIIYTFALLEGLTYGFGIWWFMYLYVWTILWGIVMLLGRKHRPAWFWAIVAAAHGLFYGLLCSLPYLFAGGPMMAFSWWITGIPFDLLHCIFNLVIVFTLFRPLDRFFARLQARNALL